MKQLFLLVFIVSVKLVNSSIEFTKLKSSHIPQEQTLDQIQYLSKLSNISHIDQILDNILIPRVVGTPNHDKVYNYIVNELKELNWHVEVDEFEDKTPIFGNLKFRNIIATLNPDAERYLVLSCHYDSKYFKDADFVGATDSAVPCAMMLNLVTVMRDDLEQIRHRSNVSLKLIFFDGEEAFEHWGPNDSIYGAKHLANKFHRTKKTSKLTGESVTNLNRIDMLMLLDLIGTPDPNFYSFFKDTERWYVRLADAEEKLASLGELRRYSNNQQQAYFKRRSSYSFIEDDHIPFLKKGVPILHLIPTPFPKEWHTPADNRAAIDLNTVENINKVLRVFVAEYLHLLLRSPQAKPFTPNQESNSFVNAPVCPFWYLTYESAPWIFADFHYCFF